MLRFVFFHDLDGRHNYPASLQGAGRVTWRIFTRAKLL